MKIGCTSRGSSIVQFTESPALTTSRDGVNRRLDAGRTTTLPHEIELPVPGSCTLMYHVLAGRAGGPILLGSHGMSVVADAFPLASTVSGVSVNRMSFGAPAGGLPTPH